jgi:hypothetical protein
MKVHTTTEQDQSQEPFASQGRSPLAMLLVILNAFVLGGCLALLIVNRLLTNQFDIYISSNSMAEVSTILDFMDDLLPLYLIYGSTLLLLFLFSAAFWAWTKTQSRLLRYGLIFLILLALAFIASTWLLGATTDPIILPQTPTPVPT